MRQIEDMDYVPTIGDELTIKYSAEHEIQTVKGKVMKVYEDENKVDTGSVWKYDVETDSGSRWFVRSIDKEDVDIFRVLTDKKHKMNLIGGQVVIEEIH